MTMINKRHPMLILYKKELASMKLGTIIAAIVILLINLIFLFNPAWVDRINGNDVAFGLSYGISWIIMVIWLFWASFRSLAQEWSTNTNYILMALPVSGLKVLFSKFLSVITFYIGILVEVNLLGDFVYYMNSGIKKVHLFTQGNIKLFDLLLIVFYFIIVTSILLILIYFSYMLSRIVGRFSKLFTGVALFASTWLFFRGSFILAGLIEKTGIPDIRVFMTYINEIDRKYISANPSPILASLIMAALFFVATAVLYDKVVEA